MQIEEGEKCNGGYGMFDIASTLQCKEGLVCARSSSEDYTYVCKKAYSKKDDFNYCDDDDDCPYDATCECDNRYGVSVCVPIPASSNKLKETYMNFYIGGDDEEIALYEYLIGEHLYYDADYYCDAYKKEIISAASSLRASAVMTAIFALVALLLSF